MVSYKIIEEHGGSIKIHSEPMQGTMVEVILPALSSVPIFPLKMKPWMQSDPGLYVLLIFQHSQTTRKSPE